jgi:hypothetical protein
MASRKQKEQLMQTLRFTPRNITISLSGYGGEIVMGTVDPAVARYWQARDDFEEYATSWSMEDDFADVPEQFRFIQDGSWYECDDLAHSCGVEMSAGCWLNITDDLTGETLMEIELDPITLKSAGIEAEEFESVEVETRPGRAVFVGQNFEKGLFFQTEVEITEPFDPAQLKFGFSTYDGWRVCNSVSYRDEELDGQDAYSTTGKSSSYELYVGDEDELSEILDTPPPIVNIDVLEGEETQAQRLIDESELGPWHASDEYRPVHIGYYDCRYAAPSWPFTSPKVERFWWDGADWITADGKPLHLHVSEWRGLNHPVDQ